MKIVVTGPESTGKSLLTKALASHYKLPYVEEYARLYLEQTHGKYSEPDLIKIAEGQIRLEDEVAKQQPEILLCDTSLEVIRIWSEWKYGHCDAAIYDKSFQRQPDLFLLLKPDVPWRADPLRENPDDRDELFSQYQKVLGEYDAKIVEISDYWEQRLHSSIVAINQLISG